MHPQSNFNPDIVKAYQRQGESREKDREEVESFGKKPLQAAKPSAKGPEMFKLLLLFESAVNLIKTTRKTIPILTDLWTPITKTKETTIRCTISHNIHSFIRPSTSIEKIPEMVFASNGQAKNLKYNSRGSYNRLKHKAQHY